MKKLITLIMAVMLTATAIYAQEKKEESKTIGLSFGANYASNYLWRGTNWFGGHAAYMPFISYDIAGIGLVATITGEITDGYGKVSNANFAKQSVDFALDYSYTFGKIFTVGAGAWYWWYLISQHSNSTDLSYMTAYVSFGLKVPLNPTIFYTHDFYFANKDYKYGDFYIQLKLSQDIPLPKGAVIKLGAALGLYNMYSTTLTKYEFDVSDITFFGGLGIEVQGVTLTGTLNYTIVPSKKFEASPDFGKFSLNVAASYAL